MKRTQAEVLKELNELMEKQKALYEALPRAIRIAELWDEAFLDGQKCQPVLVGLNDCNRMKPIYPDPYGKVKTVTRTYLKREDGTEHDITTDEFFSIITAGS
jgi:hypothetical protein